MSYQSLFLRLKIERKNVGVKFKKRSKLFAFLWFIYVCFYYSSQFALIPLQEGTYSQADVKYIKA